MDFLHGQDSLTTIEWSLRAIITFFFMLFSAKIMGSRAISQLRLLDFIIALMLGNIIAHPLSDHSIGMKGSILSTIIIVVLYMLCVYLTLKWPRFRKLMDSDPFPLIKDGEILYKGLLKARISIEYLLAELRKEKVEDVKKVALALWEADGKMSIFLDPQYEPLTPSNYQMKTEPFDLPKTIITEGKIHYHILRQLNKEENWLKDKLKAQYQSEVVNILLGTIDHQENLKIFLYK
ncbi:hypothetical protein BIV60_09410 [Bacillus sp. MUM 116]|uniref:DUF421 domain-containing protein n=1 Tax=Bacillus sp. MUM 116 TaxID=1678002 RepID=UPI0008F5CEDB|nr:DUF421 domain-containing protein [Bacillus sp. MUM 116]OIK15475.1 hypothetical protein BIV60_09410 [Bacillus sp. MUM 116]